MVIETLDKKYEVIRYLDSDKHMERYVCRDTEFAEDYFMIRIKEKKWIVSVMDFLMRQLENRDFTDLAACFFAEEHLFIAMRYVEGVTLAEKLSYEDCSLQERLEIGKAILDRLLLQHMPDYFMDDCLNDKQILLSPGMNVSFMYRMDGITDYEKTRFGDVEGRIAKLLELLFAEEIGKKTLPQMEAFIKALKKHAYQDLMSVYEVYDELYKAIPEMDPEELAMPKTRAFRAWERTKKIFRPIKKVVAALLILASIGFLIWSAYDASQTGKPKKIFENIGTLEIRQAADADTAQK